MKKIDNNISINNIKSVIYLHVLIIYIYMSIFLYTFILRYSKIYLIYLIMYLIL